MTPDSVIPIPNGHTGVASSHISSVREKVLEYRFLAELTTELLQRGIVFDVLRGDVDAQGYDIVIEANRVVRHIQLKTMVKGGKRAHVSINVNLAARPSGCVIWMRYDPDTLALGPFAWFGGAPGEPLPPLGDRVAQHSKGNALGIKTQRPGHRVVRGGAFDMIPDIATLADRLFERAPVEINELLFAQLDQNSGGNVYAMVERLCPSGMDWNNSVELAHMIDGYVLFDQLVPPAPGDATEGFDRAVAYATARHDEAKAAGHWSGALPELWTLLFILHRNARFSPYSDSPEIRAPLDRLCRQLREALVEVQYLEPD